MNTYYAGLAGVTRRNESVVSRVENWDPTHRKRFAYYVRPSVEGTAFRGGAGGGEGYRTLLYFYGVQTVFVSFLFLHVVFLFYYCCIFRRFIFVFLFCFSTMTNWFQNVYIIDFRTPVPRRRPTDYTPTAVVRIVHALHV